MIRAVIDTNLIVSYLLTQSETTSRLIDFWEQGLFTYLVSPQILHELRDVLHRPRLRQYMRGDPTILLELVEADAEFVAGKLTLTGVCRDPKDDIFIACAVEGRADYIVTGDSDLLELVSYEGIQMVRADHFVTLLQAGLDG